MGHYYADFCLFIVSSINILLNNLLIYSSIFNNQWCIKVQFIIICDTHNITDSQPLFVQKILRNLIVLIGINL